MPSQRAKGFADRIRWLMVLHRVSKGKQMMLQEIKYFFSDKEIKEMSNESNSQNISFLVGPFSPLATMINYKNKDQLFYTRNFGMNRFLKCEEPLICVVV